jgi:hypothetical protein
LTGFHFGRQLQRGPWRIDVSAAREVFLDDVVLRRAGQVLAIDARFVGDGDVEREQPGRCRVDRHRRVHRAQRNAVEERSHVAQVRDGDADFSYFALGARVIGIVAGLRGKVEGDRQSGLTAREVLAVQGI